MTAEKSIKILKAVKELKDDAIYTLTDLTEAYKMAIEALSKQSASSKQVDKSVIVDFVAFQREWLNSHKTLELDAVNNALVNIFLETTGKAFIDTLGQTSENDEAIRKDDHIADSDKMVDQFREVTKMTDDVLLNRYDVIEAVDRHTRDDGTLDDDISCILEEVSLLEQEKSNSFLKEPSESSDSEMNCSDVPDIRVGKIPYKKPEIIHCESCKHWTHTPMRGYGLGKCDFHDDDLVTRYGSCGSAERRNDG